MIGYDIIYKHGNKTIIDSYENKDLLYNENIKQLGVDSLSLFKVVIDVEAEICKEIDYLSFDIELISSINKINSFIESEKI